MHILSSEQFKKEEIDYIIKLTKDIKDNLDKYKLKLSGKIISTLFYEPSTRTRLSFESAANRLGAKVITTENAKEMSSVIKGETLSDTIRVLNAYADLIILRHTDDDSSLVAASVSTIPVINAGSGKLEHPTQALLDMYTINEFKGGFENLKVAIIGDLKHGRTIHSLIKLISLYEGITIYGVSHDELDLEENELNGLKEKGIVYEHYNDILGLPEDIDVIYHTRTQTERFSNKLERYDEIIVNEKIMDKYSKAILMHPLPRNGEISTDVDDNPRAVFFRQAHNGMYVRMAILLICFGLDK